ncbi:unnamed protein product [Protopolystoma xenopodis]|uniref:Temptin Cys/Cys disulfide domain-containing protein n=1 Tax=Protopolystoma xenopodis TaxID=117903 RepID=A0A448X0C6_9PLAT|nr:unnamed protein product [Protopolystoma xenopodis]
MSPDLQTFEKNTSKAHSHSVNIFLHILFPTQCCKVTFSSRLGPVVSCTRRQKSTTLHVWVHCDKSGEIHMSILCMACQQMVHSHVCIWQGLVGPSAIPPFSPIIVKRIGEVGNWRVELVLGCHQVWTEELCKMDSDGDGITNGEELGVPGCTWDRREPKLLPEAESHPGVCEPLYDPKCYKYNLRFTKEEMPCLDRNPPIIKDESTKWCEFFFDSFCEKLLKLLE